MDQAGDAPAGPTSNKRPYYPAVIGERCLLTDRLWKAPRRAVTRSVQCPVWASSYWADGPWDGSRALAAGPGHGDNNYTSAHDRFAASTISSQDPALATHFYQHQTYESTSIFFFKYGGLGVKYAIHHIHHFKTHFSFKTYISCAYIAIMHSYLYYYFYLFVYLLIKRWNSYLLVASGSRSAIYIP